MAVAMMATLKSEVASLERHYRAQRYPAELRERVVTAARALRDEGVNWGRIGSAVGIRSETLRRWCEGGGASSGTALVPVHVVGRSSGVAVVSPRGWRIEGLSLADAASLMRSLP